MKNTAQYVIIYLPLKIKYYHPDIIIPKESLIIEVKSEYTAKSDIKLTAKQKACENVGYKFKLVIVPRPK